MAAIGDLARGFTDLVRTRGGDHLAAWIEQAEQHTIAEIRSFASGLRKDWDAVKAGLKHGVELRRCRRRREPHQNAQTAMYGRANPDLLRRRIMLAD